MGFWDAFRRAPAPVEERATYYAPSSPAWIGTSAAPVVTHNTAAQSVAIRSTADLIASLMSELPITVYSGSRSQRREVATPANLEDPGGDGMGRQDWMYRLAWSWLIAGNAFGMPVDFDPRSGRLLTCDLINMDQVSPSVVDGKAVFYVAGKRADQLVHWRVNPMPGRLLGLSPIEHHAATIGVSLATTRFGREWFTDSAHPAGMLTTAANLDAEKADTAKQRFMARGPREPLVVGGGWDWKEIQVSPEESQFLQTMGLSEAQCARIFGPGFAEILGYETGSKMTYGNVVDRRQDLLVLGLNRWLRRAERVYSALLPPTDWAEINRDALLEATTMQRYTAHESALRAGWRTINEIREIEHLDSVTWGELPKPSNGTEIPNGETAA